MGKGGGKGISLLDPDDDGQGQDGADGFNFEPTDEFGFEHESDTIDKQVKRSIIVEKSQGMPNKVIALRWQVGESTVAKIWKQFIDSTVDVRRLGDENPEVFHQKIRRKAANAIENGLDCERDPYRQANVGIQVMKGIGVFKETSESTNHHLHVLVNATPDDWKSRYIGQTKQIAQNKPRIPEVIETKPEEENNGK